MQITKPSHLHVVGEAAAHAHVSRVQPGSAVLAGAGLRLVAAAVISAAIWGGVLLAML